MLGPLLLCLGMSGHLGTVDFPVTCSPEARVEFNHAVALLRSRELDKRLRPGIAKR